MNETDTAREQRVILQAETLEYSPSEKRLVAEGKVSVTHGETRMLADRLELNTESGVGSAWGNVQLLTPEDDVKAERMDFDLTAEQGVLYDSTGVVARVYRVAGERIVRQGPKTYTVQRGRLTTCTSPVPEWEFRARQARVGLGDYVALQEPTFWIKGIPVFYVPYLVFPLRDKRTTGFLPPRVGTSNEDGYTVLTQFYWAIADWTDATFGLEYLSEKGVKPEAEFRYAVDPLSDGQLEGAFIREQDTGETLWRVLLQQRQEFGWGIRGLTQVDLRSERDILRRFSSDIRQESQVRTESFGTLTKLFTDGSLTLAGDSYEGIVESGFVGQFRRLPTLRFQQFPTPLLGGRAFFEVETSYSRLSIRDPRGDPRSTIANNTPVQRFDLFPRLILLLPLAPWTRLTVVGGVHETFYDHQAVESTGTWRQIGDVRAYLEGPALWRRYARSGGQSALLHMVETRLAYRYVPSVDQDDVPAFEALDEPVHFLDPLETFTLIDRLTAANYAKISVVNRLFTVGGAGSAQEVVRFIISQGLDIREATVGRGQLLGPLDIEMQFHWPRWQLASVLRLDTATGALQEANWRALFFVRPNWFVYAASNHRERIGQEPETLYVSGGTQMTLLGGLQVGYFFRYDGLSGSLREHVATLLYRAQCWSVEMRFRVREVGDTEFTIKADLFRF
jgi:LPS-assembly protein